MALVIHSIGSGNVVNGDLNVAVARDHDGALKMRKDPSAAVS